MEMQYIDWSVIFEHLEPYDIGTIVRGMAATSKHAANCVLVTLWNTSLEVGKANRALFAYGARPILADDAGLEIQCSDEVKLDPTSGLSSLARTYSFVFTGEMAEKTKPMYGKRRSALNQALSATEHLWPSNPHRSRVSFAINDKIEPITADNKRKDDWIAEWFMPFDEKPRKFWEQCDDAMHYWLYVWAMRKARTKKFFPLSDGAPLAKLDSRRMLRFALDHSEYQGPEDVVLFSMLKHYKFDPKMFDSILKWFPLNKRALSVAIHIKLGKESPAACTSRVLRRLAQNSKNPTLLNRFLAGFQFGDQDVLHIFLKGLEIDLKMIKMLHQRYPDRDYDRFAETQLHSLVFDDRFIRKPLGAFAWKIIQDVVKTSYDSSSSWKFVAFLYFQKDPYLEHLMEALKDDPHVGELARKTLENMFTTRPLHKVIPFHYEFQKHPIYRERFAILFRLAAPYPTHFATYFLKLLFETKLLADIQTRTFFVEQFFAHLGDESIDSSFPVKFLIPDAFTSFTSHVFDRNLPSDIYQALVKKAFFAATNKDNCKEIDKFCQVVSKKEIEYFCDQLKPTTSSNLCFGRRYAIEMLVSNRLETLRCLDMCSLNACMRVLCTLPSGRGRDAQEEQARMQSMAKLSSMMYEMHIESESASAPLELDHEGESISAPLEPGNEFYFGKRKIKDDQQLPVKFAKHSQDSDVIVIE